MFTSSLGAGGAERALTVLAAGFADRGHSVSVVTWNSGIPDFYTLPDFVVRTRVPLDAGTISVSWFNPYGNLRRVLAIRRAIMATDPDIGISFLDGSNELFLLATAGLRIGKFISSQNNLSERGHYNRRWELLRKFAYKGADSIVFLDPRAAEAARKRFPSWNCTSIPNPLTRIVEQPDTTAASIISDMRRFPVRIVAMGRFVEQKGFDLLLRAFKSVTEQVDDVGLVILGDGPLRAALERQCRDLQLTEKVLLPGKTSMPHAVIARCDLFVFPSRYEGQGMALAEAMASGVPAVSFDCDYGPRSMIQATGGGILVPVGDVPALTAAIVELLQNDGLRATYGGNARRINDMLSVDTITERWEQLFHEYH